jgi:ATP-binding cassette subfamily C protein
MFSSPDQKKLIAVSIIQILLGLLDLIGVAAIGLLGALTVNGIQSQQPTGRIYSVLETLGISTLSFQTQVAILGIFATLIFVLRTFSSIYFSRRILRFLALRTAFVSNKLVSKLLNLPPLKLQENSTQETMYAISNGVNNITIGIVGTILTLVADTSIFVLLSAGLFIVDPLLALSSLILFSATAYLLFRRMQVKARNFGETSTNLSIRNNEKLLEILTSYRETIVRGRRDYYINAISEYRRKIALTSAELAFLPNISKYVIETVLVVGTLVICGIQFLANDALHAISVLTVFLAAGSRLAPAVLRIQQGAIQIKSNIGSSLQTLALIENLNWDELVLSNSKDPTFIYDGFNPHVKVVNLSVTYEGNPSPTLFKLDLEIFEGEVVAIAGPSGAGKTTLIDSILGLITPLTGEVAISGLSPNECIDKWPGAISYVPQNVSIMNGTILENVTLGYPEHLVERDQVERALSVAQLSEFVTELPQGVNTRVGEFGSKISGGQRQRLGIARAMYSNPRLLVLDEATSALDSITEERIGNMLAKLKGNTTVILIAHRLSTVRQSDRVVYIDNGQLIADGSFDFVTRQVPDFNKAANFLDVENT